MDDGNPTYFDLETVALLRATPGRSLSATVETAPIISAVSAFALRSNSSAVGLDCHGGLADAGLPHGLSVNGQQFVVFFERISYLEAGLHQINEASGRTAYCGAFPA
jgi:hypothetical protein